MHKNARASTVRAFVEHDEGTGGLAPRVVGAGGVDLGRDAERQAGQPLRGAASTASFKPMVVMFDVSFFGEKRRFDHFIFAAARATSM